MSKLDISEAEVDILAALTSTYHAFYVINMEDGSFVEKGKAHDYVEAVIGRSGIAAERMDAMCRLIVAEEYREDMRLFSDLSTLNERLRDKKWITCQFPNINGKWSEGYFIVAKRNEQGDCTRIIWAVRDIDRLKKKELAYQMALQKAKLLAEERNEELSKQLDIIKAVGKNFSGIYYADLRDFSFVELGVKSANVRKIIGQKGEARAALDRMCDYLIVEEQREKMRKFSDLTTLNERLKNREWVSVHFLSTRGEWLEGTFIAADRDEEGNVVHFLWVTRDIDESKTKELAYQKALEKAMIDAEAANEAKTSFLFNMSHDIRTPMNAILGYTELLKKNLGDKEKCTDYLKKIHSSGDFLLSLINNVLEMARIESGKSNLDEMACGVLELHTEIANVYAELMRNKNIDFVCSCEVPTPYVYLDKVKINEIFLNLVSNAYKYTPEGGTITMSVAEVPCDRAGYINIRTTISDTGIGMSKEYMAVMFEEFSRERTATETKIQGTGLGLPIVKKLIELMEGTVEVESELGKGTTFVVVLPHRIAEKPQEISALPTDKAKCCFTGRRVLLAEDNELNAEIAMEIMRDEGLEVDWAADGIICVDMLQKAEPQHYDLILMDIQMPNMDGYKATKVIRQMEDPIRRSIPIVAMTANAFDEDKHNAVMAGMNGHLPKPIEVPKLMAVLQEYIR